MAKRVLGISVSGETATIVDAQVPDDASEPITIVADDTWKLQKGDKGQAYAVLYQRCSDYVRENKIESVVVKASALSTGPARLGLLTSAELRGVVIAAAAGTCDVQVVSKAAVSRTYGERKVDEYVDDDKFWSEQTSGGKLRKMSREAAMMIVAKREA